MKKHLLAVLILLSSTTVFGAGYQLNLQGIRQLAMGGTGTAWPWDASTIFYNPGGLARLKSIQAYASIVFVVPATSFSNPILRSSTTTRPQTFTPFNIYVGGPIQHDSKFALGLGIYTAAGIGIKWDDNWIGKYMVQSINFNAVMFQPTISYRVGNFLSVGGGFVYGAGSIDLRQALPVHGYNGPQPPNEDNGETRLHGSANGVGFNLGIQLKPSDNFQVGFTYRSQVNMGVSGGAATFTVPNSLRSSFPTTTFDSNLPLPQVASFGIGIRPLERLTLQFDLNYTGWNSYDTLRINFTDHTPALQNIRAPRCYKNTWTPRVGACYKVSKVVSLMAGAVYDPTPVPDGFVSPDLPDADRICISAGISIKPLRGFTILAAFEGTDALKRSGNYTYGGFSGVYKTEAASPALAVYYNF